MIQDETDFEKLYADAALAQTILIDALKKLPGDVSDPGVRGGSAERKLADKYTDKSGATSREASGSSPRDSPVRERRRPSEGAD